MRDDCETGELNYLELNLMFCGVKALRKYSLISNLVAFFVGINYEG